MGSKLFKIEKKTLNATTERKKIKLKTPPIRFFITLWGTTLRVFEWISQNPGRKRLKMECYVFFWNQLVVVSTYTVTEIRYR